EAPHRAVELDPRTDVDAARRLVHDEERGPALEPACEHDLLLVATGERRDRLQRGVPRADRERVAPPPVRARLRAARDEEAEAGEPPPGRRRDVLGHGPNAEDRLALAVGRDEADPAADRRPGAARRRRPPCNEELPGAERLQPEDSLRNLGGARPELPV